MTNILNPLEFLQTRKMDMSDLKDMCGFARTFFGNETIIAGGAPRDTLMGVEVKDIDVFVQIDLTPGENTLFTRCCEDFADFLGGEAKFRKAQKDYNVFNLCDIIIPDNWPVQIIGLEQLPIDDVPLYDFGLSQMFVTPTGLFLSPAAISDMTSKTITYQPRIFEQVDEPRVKRSKARLERLRAKYVGWNFVNCERLDDYNPLEEDAIKE